MSDEVRIPIPEQSTISREAFSLTYLTMSREVYREFVEAVSREGQYGDPVHWETYHRMHVERDTAQREHRIAEKALADSVKEVEQLKAAIESWRALAAANDVDSFPVRHQLRTAQRERDEWKARFEGAKANAEYVRSQYGHPDEVEELREAVVRQAREISRLTEESE